MMFLLTKVQVLLLARYLAVNVLLPTDLLPVKMARTAVVEITTTNTATASSNSSELVGRLMAVTLRRRAGAPPRTK